MVLEKGKGITTVEALVVKADLNVSVKSKGEGLWISN
jgi:hypothetical protein